MWPLQNSHVVQLEKSQQLNLAALPSLSHVSMDKRCKRKWTRPKGPCLLKGNFHDSVGSLVEGLGFSDRTFSCIIASKSECYSCPHEIALDTPLSVCHDFNLKFVCCFIENPVTQPESSGTVRNAFSFLMERSRELPR